LGLGDAIWKKRGAAPKPPIKTNLIFLAGSMIKDKDIKKAAKLLKYTAE